MGNEVSRSSRSRMPPSGVDRDPERAPTPHRNSTASRHQRDLPFEDRLYEGAMLDRRISVLLEAGRPGRHGRSPKEPVVRLRVLQYMSIIHMKRLLAREVALMSERRHVTDSQMERVKGLMSDYVGALRDLQYMLEPTSRFARTASFLRDQFYINMDNDSAILESEGLIHEDYPFPRKGYDVPVPEYAGYGGFSHTIDNRLEFLGRLRLVTASAAVLILGAILAYLEEMQKKDVVAGTAAYAAVLVVFIGTSGYLVGVGKEYNVSGKEAEVRSQSGHLTRPAFRDRVASGYGGSAMLSPPRTQPPPRKTTTHRYLRERPSTNDSIISSHDRYTMMKAPHLQPAEPATWTIPLRPLISLAPSQDSPVNSVADSAREGLSITSLLTTVLSRHVPIFKKNPVDISSVRQVAESGSYVLSYAITSTDESRVILARLQDKPGSQYLDDADLAELINQPFFRYLIEPEDKEYQLIGETRVFMKSVNPDILGRDNDVGALDYSALCTEVTILSDPSIKTERYIEHINGVGWEPLVVATASEQIRHYPYLLTDAGHGHNLDDFFRDKHSSRAYITRTLKKADYRLPLRPLPWNTKVEIARCIALALSRLHHCGVVHGDVKAENVIRAYPSFLDLSDDSLTFKLCHFENSLILSDYMGMENPTCRLLSKTFPWEAPEARNLSLTMQQAIQADIYSYGLLLAKIFLDGNCPLDEEFDIVYPTTPRHDPAAVEQLKINHDLTLASRLAARLEAVKCYNQNQIARLRAILEATLAKDSKDRIKCISHVVGELNKGSEKSTSPSPNKRHPGHSKESCEDCSLDMVKIVKQRKLNDLFIAHSQYRNVQLNQAIMYEALVDLERLAHHGRGEDKSSALYQAAILHYHGWGTAPSVTTAVDWLCRAAAAGSKAATIVLAQVLAAKGIPITGEYRRVINDALEVFPQASNRCFALALETLKPGAFTQALRLCKQEWLDLFEPGPRVKIVRGSSEEGEVQFLLVGINDLDDVDDVEHAVVLPPLRAFFGRDLQVVVLVGFEVSGEGETRPMRAADVSRMVRNGSNVNEFGPVGHTALWLACNRGNYELTKALLNSGASPKRADGLRRCTPLHFLSRFEPTNIREIADLLVKAGTDLEAVNKQGQTPLMAAISPKEQPMPRSALPAVRALLALGASPVAQMQDEQVLTCSFGRGEGTLPDCPVALACASLELDIFELLMDRIRQLGSSPAGLRRLAHCFALAIQRPPVVAPVLHRNWEQKGGYKSPVHRLVDYLLDPDLMLFFSRMKYSPLHQAIAQGAFDFVETILEMGKFEKSDLTSRRVLEAAFQRRSVELIERLLQYGFKFDKETLGDGETFLHLAIASNWTVDMLSKACDLAQIKLILPALAGARDNRGAIPFASAVIKGHFAIADYLAQLSPQNTIDAQTFVLDSGHDAYCAVFPFGWPCVSLLGYCLGATVDEGLKVQQAKYLLKFKPAFRVSQTHGCTALTLCWKDWKYHQKRSLSPKLESSYSATLVDILLQHYAEKELLNQADYLGIAPLHYACASGNVHGVQRLLEADADINAMDHGGMTPLDVNGTDAYMGEPSEELRLFEAVQLEVSVFFELHQLLSAKGGLSGKACLEARKEKPVPGSKFLHECRLAEDCHRVKTALWKQFGVTRLTRQPGSIHTFMLEEAHRKPEGWTEPVELADSDAESFLASGTQAGSSSTAVQIGGDEIKTTQQNKTWKIDNIPGLEEYLAKPGWCAKVRSVVVNRAGNHLKEIGIMTRNRANRKNKAAALDKQLSCTKTAEQIQEILGKHARVETGLRRLIARLAAGSVADLAAKSLAKNDGEEMEYYEENQLQLLRIRALAQCKFLKELNGMSGQGDCIGKALAAIL
ncbi:hypothetical protein V8F06_009554 [Rhypophila decipiens]